MVLRLLKHELKYKLKCIQKIRYGDTFVNTVANHYQTHSTFTQPSQWTSSTIIKLICFETIALLFVVVYTYGHFIFQITKMYVIYTKLKKPIMKKITDIVATI